MQIRSQIFLSSLVPKATTHAIIPTAIFEFCILQSAKRTNGLNFRTTLYAVSHPFLHASGDEYLQRFVPNYGIRFIHVVTEDCMKIVGPRELLSLVSFVSACIKI